MKQIIIVLLLLILIGFSSCCTFCKLESTIEYSVDTVYVATSDTITGGLIADSDTATSSGFVFTLVDHNGNDPFYTPADTINYFYYTDVNEDDLVYWQAVSCISDSLSSYISVTSLDTIELETEYASAKAWVFDSELNGTIENKEYGRVIIDSLQTIIYTNETTISELSSNNDSYKTKYKRSRRNNIMLGTILSIICLLVIGTMIKNMLKK